MGYKLQSHLANSQLVILPRSKHSLPSERPVVVAEQILSFLARNGSGGRPVPATVSSIELEPVRELPLAEIDASDQFKRDGIRLPQE